MTVADMMARMTFEEFLGWSAFFKVREQKIRES